MNRENHYMLVLFRNGARDGLGIDLETEYLQSILHEIMTSEHFCKVHELATRYGITTKKAPMLRELQYTEMSAFRFFINKN